MKMRVTRLTARQSVVPLMRPRAGTDAVLSATHASVELHRRRLVPVPLPMATSSRPLPRSRSRSARSTTRRRSRRAAWSRSTGTRAPPRRLGLSDQHRPGKRGGQQRRFVLGTSSNRGLFRTGLLLYCEVLPILHTCFRPFGNRPGSYPTVSLASDLTSQRPIKSALRATTSAPNSDHFAHTCHGGSPWATISSSSTLSLNVSMLRQNPSYG